MYFFKSAPLVLALFLRNSIKFLFTSRIKQAGFPEHPVPVLKPVHHEQMAPSCNKWFSAELPLIMKTRLTSGVVGKERDIHHVPRISKHLKPCSRRTLKCLFSQVET